MAQTPAIELLRVIGERVAGKTGEDFFRQIVREIALTLQAPYAFASRFNRDEHSARVLAYWVHDRYEPFPDYQLAGTPCELVFHGNVTVFRDNLVEQFPLDREWFEQLGLKSYLAIPVRTEGGVVCGHLAVMDTRDRNWGEADVDVLRLFSLRAAAELDRMAYEERLERTNAALEQANGQLRLEILERIRMEQDLSAAKAEAESASHAKSAFLASMSHELRTPLNGVLGYAQLLARDPALSPAQKDGLAVISRSGKHLLELIGDLLDLARIEAGKVEGERRVTSLPAELQYVADLGAVRAREAGLAFRYELDASVPEMATLDARALRQLLINLVANAVKFTDRGGQVVLRAALAAGADGAPCLRVEVEDTGIGIPESALASIFEPFHRQLTPGRTTEGTGLGLAIARRLAQQLGGDLTVTSRPGIGSRFCATVALEVATGAERPPASARSISGYAGPRRRLLIADGAHVDRQLLVRFLESLGFECVGAADGPAACGALLRGGFDAVVTELELAGADGHAVLAAARARGATPVLAVSASAHADSRARACDCGYADFLAKPWDMDRLLERLGVVLGLTWIAAPPPEPAGPAAPAASTDALDPALAQALYHRARTGDVLELRAAIDAAFGRPGASALAGELRRLADSYDMAAVRRLLEPFLAPASRTPS